jgi:hypothetical protein
MQAIATDASRANLMHLVILIDLFVVTLLVEI